MVCAIVLIFLFIYANIHKNKGVIFNVRALNQIVEINVIKYLLFVITRTALTTRSIPILNRFFKFFKRSYFFIIFGKFIPDMWP